MKPLRAHESKNQYLSRQKQLARALHARIYAATNGELWFVSGQPDPDRMERRLSHLGDQHNHVVTPAELGFCVCRIEQVTDLKLTVASGALTKWERTARHGRLANRHTDDLSEIHQLRERLQSLYAWRRDTELAQGGQMCWMLDDRQQGELQAALRAVPSEIRDMRFDWFAQLVLWIAGPTALPRFCAAAALLPTVTTESTARAALRSSLGRFDAWMRRSQHEHWRQIRYEVKRWIGQLPPQVVASAGLSSKLRQDTLLSQLEKQRAHCSQALRECRDGGRQTLLSAIATVAACDGSRVPLPEELIESWAAAEHPRDVSEVAVKLAEEARLPGYDLLLTQFPRLPELPTYNYGYVRKELHRGESVADICWVLDKGLQSCFSGEAPLTTRWVRATGARLGSAGLDLNDSQLWDLFAAIDTQDDRDAARGFVDWVAAIPAAARTPRLCRLLTSTLLGPYVTAFSELSCYEELRQWRRLVGRRSAPGAAHDATAWATRVVRLEEATGKPRRAVGSTDRVLKLTRKRRDELTFLRRLVDRGEANRLQLLRMRHLTQDSRRQRAHQEEKLVRSLQRSYVVAAVEALLHAVRGSASRAIGSALSERLHNEKLGRVLEFAGWVQEMSAAQSVLLHDLLAAHHEHGECYKHQLPCNQRWVQAMDAAPLDLKAWMSPEPWDGLVENQHVTIAASTDPVETFLMGAYFGTCLSLDDCNRMSVLANAAHANKQVLYARDLAGKVLARQLIAISTGGDLLGYYCYVSESGKNTSFRDAMTTAMTNYCVRLAERCGIRLADEGEPRSIGNHFWYDDEPVEWELPKDQPSLRPPAAAPAVEAVFHAV